MISAGDELPLHQTSRPVRDPGTNRNLYDRFFFNGYPRDGSAFLAVALGQYPGRDVADAAVSWCVDGVQHNVRASRRLGPDRLDTGVGPIRIEIVEPLRRLRIVVDDPESGVAADLAFSARAAPFEEPHYTWQNGYRTIMDVTRLTQCGTWTGWFRLPDGPEIPVDGWWGSRDRSWGTRPVGEREPAGAPDGVAGFYWLWAPVQFDDECYLFDVNERPSGARWHHSAMVVPVGGDTADIETGSADYRLDYRPGSRYAARFELAFDVPSGPRRLVLEPQWAFLMQGIGYGHPSWAHGTFHGDADRVYDQYDVAAVDAADPHHQHVQAVCRVERDDGSEGVGVLEQLIVGPHEPSGFTGLLDGHA